MIGQDKVLIPMNRNCNEICDILGIYKIRTQEIPSVFFCKITI